MTVKFMRINFFVGSNINVVNVVDKCLDSNYFFI